MKKHILKKQNGMTLKEKNLWAIIAVLVIAQIISFTYIVRNNNSLNESSKLRLSQLISATEEKRYRYPVIDVSENRVYIPEARVYLPLNDTTRNIRYDFRDDENNAALYFSLPIAIGHQTDQDDPACDKMVALTQSKQSGILGEFVGEVPVTQNSLRYVSRHAACQIYSDAASRDLAEIIEQIRPY